MALSSLLLLGISCALRVIKTVEHGKTFHVCGNDGKNYDSIGDLYQAKLENPYLRVRYVGVCRKRSPKHSAYNEHYKNEDKAIACPLIGAPVCGTDGTTYENECFLYYEKAKNPNLYLKHRGECNENSKEIKHEIETNHCELTLKPVCGSDGRSYGNECFLNFYKKYDYTLYKKHKGWCKKKLDSRNMPVFMACPLNYRPVCGTDGKNYDNECLFMSQKRFNPALEIKHEGECKEKLETARSTGYCHTIYLPVCDTKGNMYANECLFNAFKESIDPTVKIKHIGECNRKFRNSDYENLDLFEEWANPMTCIPRGPPVCGTDGKTHGNLCILNANKKYNPSLQFKHFGRCSYLKRSRLQHTKTNVAIKKDDKNGKSLNVGVRMSNYNRSYHENDIYGL